ncbi:hypothetical protein Barba19A_gp087 [Rheinheimera phage vB_RspM_Barba19A]|uniref:Uncharacterized protein n=2 Tax=Barbavirus barba19A TaxID=2734091 RepID=A0A4P8NF89_9CAUD|nr:hypothetical protein HOV47_gp087 [Rheinheimera phage vB_RspM_Barba19A]QCQ61927.1 hypothetical protein Barba19A_gp087 [Rheinheimera phage vB_RspM_Barba19A]QCQ64677.1 hypothetical protein Barba31A_gp087 [Rheinheimera phage vB_RspM_Barba31A]
MINWIKSLFKKTPPDISEPVISFVELVKNNPDRFRLNLDSKASKEYLRDNYKWGYNLYILLDKQFKQQNVLGVLDINLCSFDAPRFISDESVSYLTGDEREYIYEQLKPIFQARGDKLRLIRSQRKARDDQRKSERDIKKYCKE